MDIPIPRQISSSRGATWALYGGLLCGLGLGSRALILAVLFGADARRWPALFIVDALVGSVGVCVTIALLLALLFGANLSRGACWFFGLTWGRALQAVVIGVYLGITHRTEMGTWAAMLYCCGLPVGLAAGGIVARRVNGFTSSARRGTVIGLVLGMLLAAALVTIAVVVIRRGSVWPDDSSQQVATLLGLSMLSLPVASSVGTVVAVWGVRKAEHDSNRRVC